MAGIIAAVALTPVLGPVAAGFISGVISGGDLKSGIIGAVTAGAFGQLHTLGSGIGKTLAHGVVGGLSSVAQGGKFGSGFLAAGFTQAASPLIGGINPGHVGSDIGRTVAAAVVGGTASVLGGGKFANGAVTGAFSRLFNDDLQRSRSEMGPEAQRRSDLERVKHALDDGRLTVSESNAIYRTNSNPNLLVTVNSGDLTVEQTGNFVNGKAPGVVLGVNDYLVHGRVTLASRADGSIGIYDGQYDFELHP